MKIAVKQADLFVEGVTVRVVRMAQVVTELVVEIDGRKVTGSAVQCLAPTRFTGSACSSYRNDVADMLHVIETACDFAVQVTAGKHAAESVFDLWQRVYMEQGKWAGGEGYGPGLWMMGLSVMERAVIDAACRSKSASLAAAVRTNLLGLRLGEMHAELAKFQPAQLLPPAPLAEVGVCKGVALEDAERLIAVARELPGGGSPVHLLGGERFASIAELRELWEKLRGMPELAGLLSRVAWIAQPVAHHAAILAENEDALLDWEDRPAIVIDDSNCGITSVADAMDSGYGGALHRDCRGVMKGIADACLMEHRRRVEPEERAVLGVADSLVVGAAGQARDLAGAASLGISPLVAWATDEHPCQSPPRTPLDAWTFDSLAAR